MLFRSKASWCLLLCLVAACTDARNERPIIGVVSEKVANSTRSYIAASYVKYLESAGARVVPVLSNSTDAQIEYLFKSLNGILFPGGGVSTADSGYANVGAEMFRLAKEANQNGDYFPLWGTCLGFELLGVLQAGSTSVLGHVDAENLTLALDFTADGHSSRLFSLFSPEALKWISSEKLTLNAHTRSITMETFNSNAKLNTFFTALSTNKDRHGVEFVSSMEAKDFPFYAVQWHPEKNGFEWGITAATDHSEHAVAIMQMTADFFVEEARHSNHAFPSEKEERDHLIYNYQPTFTNDYFVQKYIL